MKKSIITLLICLFTIGVVFTLCACNGQNEGDNIKAPSWAEEENECQHKEWKLVGSLEATCENEGYTRLECLECKENKLILYPQKPCDYEVSWEWGSSAYTTIIRFKCPRTNAHNQVKTAFQQSSTVIKEATCQEYGERLRYAEVRDKYGRIHTAEKIEKFKVGCSMNSVTVRPEHCYESGKVVGKCKWCGTERVQHSYADGHTTPKEIGSYNLADYGCCNGYVSYVACECRHDSVINIQKSCTLTEVAEFTEIPLENGNKVVHKVVTSSCSKCNFKIVKKEGNFISENNDGETIVIALYKITEIVISEDITVKNILESESGIHGLLGHNVKTEYEYLGQECSDGCRINIKCQDCAYEEIKYTSDHAYTEKKINLADYGACGRTLVLRECRCGDIFDAYFCLTESNCTFEDISVSEYLGCEINAIQKAHKCTKCGFSYFFGRIYYKTGEEKLYYFFDIYSARINGETVLEIKQFEGVVSSYDRYNVCELSLTDDEKQNIIDYLERCLNDDILTEYRYEAYQRMIERLRNELDAPNEPDAPMPDIPDEPEELPALVPEELQAHLELLGDCQNVCRFEYANVLTDYKIPYDFEPVSDFVVKCPDCKTEVVCAYGIKDGETGYFLIPDPNNTEEYVWVPYDAPTPDIPEEPDTPDEPNEPDIWEDFNFDYRPITEEEKRAILEYFKGLLESDTADLTEEQRAQYEEAVKQLEAELGIAEDIV